MSLVGGIVLLNFVLLAAGYCLLAAPLLGKSALCWASYAGVALLVGAGVVLTLVFFAYIAGAENGVAALTAATAAAALAGLLAARSDRLRAWSAPQPPPSRPVSALETALLTAVAAIAAAALVGGFRSSPWLDDVWGIWVPKGIALDRLGLDPSLFAPNGRYETFGVLDYPLWWSSLTGLDLRFVGGVDLRAVNAEATILVLAFLGAAGRLLWGYVRPWVLGASLLLLAASPELFRHAQGGVADLPLAVYLALSALAAIGWLARGTGFHLALVAAFGATAVQIKTEGLFELAVVALFTALLAWRLVPGRLLRLLCAWAVAFAAAAPWLIWRAVHDVPAEIPLSRAFSPGYLLGRSGRIPTSAETFARHLFTPREWLVVVPLALGLALFGAISRRSAAWLAPVGLLAALFAFWVWVYWADPERLDYLLGTSSYRVADSTILLAWLSVPLLAERLLQTRSP